MENVWTEQELWKCLDRDVNKLKTDVDARNLDAIYSNICTMLDVLVTEALALKHTNDPDYAEAINETEALTKWCDTHCAFCGAELKNNDCTRWKENSGIIRYFCDDGCGEAWFDGDELWTADNKFIRVYRQVDLNRFAVNEIKC